MARSQGIAAERSGNLRRWGGSAELQAGRRTVPGKAVGWAVVPVTEEGSTGL